MARLLLVDDDREFLDVLALSLREDGHDVEIARDGREAERAVLASPPALVICDVNLPGVDGFTLVKRWRGRGLALPILLLTSRDSEIDEALGLELGADDYVSKPVRLRVLSARVGALLRRAERRGGSATSPPSLDAAADPPLIVVGASSVDLGRLELRHRGTVVPTTLSEIRLLEALLLRPGIVQSRSRLLEHVRGDDGGVDDRLIDTYVRRLRRKLEAIDPLFDSIETVTGAGYRWRTP